MITTYTYNNPLNFTFDSGKIAFPGTLAKLLLQQSSLPFSQPFDNDTGFTYNPAEIEFVAGECRQKDRRPAGLTCAVNYNLSSIDLNYGNGVLTGTGFGTPTITGSKLDLTGATKYVQYAGIGNADSPQTGCRRFRYTPVDVAAPPATRMLYSNYRQAGSVTNLIMIYQSTARSLNISIYNSAGVAISLTNLGLWTQTAGQEYEFELNYDLTAGATRLFIDGVQFGVTITATGTRDSNINYLNIGADYNGSNMANAYFDDIQVFSTVQHTANYTPGYTVPDYIYATTNVILPEMEHTGDGSILSFDAFTTTETGAPRHALQIGRSGNYLYWNGSAWVISDVSYSQSNTQTVFNANCATLAVSGEKYGQFQIAFLESNTISSISLLTATMTVNTGYPTTNPDILTNSSFRADGLLGLSMVANITGLDAIRLTLLKDSVDYYWTGAAWAVSNGTYAQANTLADILTNKASFLTEGSGKNIKIRAFPHSNDGTTTPELTSITIEYDFSGELPTLTNITLCGYLRDITDAMIGTAIQVKPAYTIGGKTIINNNYKTITTTVEGYFEIDLKIENVVPSYLIWQIGNEVIKTSFKNAENVYFGELTILERSTRI